MSELKARLQNEMKEAMKAKQKDRLMAIRLVNAAIKQREVDERIELTDEDILAILDKLAKQRRESIAQFQAAERADLVEKEQQELEVIQEFLPEQMSEAELKALVQDAVSSTQAASVKDMGKVMGVLKPKVQGRADMGLVGKLVKDCLG